MNNNKKYGDGIKLKYRAKILSVREFDFSYTDTTKVKILATDKVGKEILVYNGRKYEIWIIYKYSLYAVKKG